MNDKMHGGVSHILLPLVKLESGHVSFTIQKLGKKQ
jgi:hypothetical protein